MRVSGSGSITSVGEERANLSAVVTCNYVVSVWRDFLVLWVLGMGYVILLWHSLGLPFIIFQMKCFDIFLIFAQNMDCGYTLEPPQRGGSIEYPQAMF